MPSSACKTCALRSEEHTSELQSHDNLVCRLLLETKNPDQDRRHSAAAGVPPRRERDDPARGAGAPRRGGGRWPRVRPRPRVGRPSVFFFNEPATPETCPLSPRPPLPT